MNLRKNKLLVAIIVTVALTLVGCNRKTVYCHYQSVGVDGWERSQTFYFCLSPIDQTATYARELGLRTNSAYPFTSLSLIVEQLVLPSGSHHVDTLQCQLTDDAGTILGKGTYHYQYLFALPSVPLHEGDSLTISVRHNMKREVLPGITDVGLFVRIQDVRDSDRHQYVGR